jgi:hypothetical protein
MPLSFSRFSRAAAVAAAVGVLWAASAGSAQAMCGGNIFATCSPAAKKAPPVLESRTKPRKRRAATAAR